MRSANPKRWLGLGLLALLSFAVVAVPVALIRPFAPQTPATMSIAFTLRRWSPLLTLAALVLGAVLLYRLWRSSPRAVPRIGAVLLALPLVGAAWFSRQAYFEWMFAPLPDARFVRAAAADFARPDDMVLAVTIQGDAVAYPVPQLAYHHLVEDEVGNVPIVATY